MTHFQDVLTVRNGQSEHHQSSLFALPSRITLRDAARKQLSIRRHFVGTLGVGQVVSTGHDTQVTEPSGLTLLLPLCGRLISRTADGTELRAENGSALIFSPNRRETRVQADKQKMFLAETLILPINELVIELERNGYSANTRQMLADFSVLTPNVNSPEATQLTSSALELYSEVLAGSPKLSTKQSQRSWTRLISARTLDLLRAAGLLDDRRDTSLPAAERHVRTATEFMRENHADITTIVDVAEACGVSLRRLETAFRSVWGQTPNDALREIRLQKARRDLVFADPEERVSRIAWNNGFNHLGRFANAYIQRFGESPSQTLRSVGN
ncbi:helix-turn-helix transcriptional regulator [Sulfitobacter sp. D35]|uniref:helix-turn-helix transcriptional regulator n=1 Tax=Sulfitobacter sp. D35 TaxID=3083252 RepID=UPI00296EC738|nr:helix-turn-helix transcriptional regulator [Sulfitobacter sp. D35]MDW4496572.1 helix-turn-helix transcriptional regulator [Sulfitobacter sp. D35]